MGLNTPLGIWLIAGVSSIALAAVVVTIATRTVHADARLSLPSAVPPPAPTTATPVFHAPQTAAKSRPLGIASWYGSVLNGHFTASGERFNMLAMTACSNVLPFGTRVRVVNLNNKKSVVVRINDRGVLSEGRVIDLSYAAAQQLKITKAGLAPVALEILSMGRPRHDR